MEESRMKTVSLDKVVKLDVTIKDRDFYSQPQEIEERPEYIRVPLSAMWFRGVEGPAAGASNALLKEIVGQIEEQMKERLYIYVNADSILK